MLSKKEIELVKSMDNVAFYLIDAYNALLIKEANDEKITFVDPIGKVHKVKTYFGNKYNYFMFGYWRIRLDECVKI